MKYKAIFLDDKDFEALPYRDMHDKIGVADPKTGVAYARKSGVPVIDAFTIMHELEHLEDGHEGVHADHYDPEHGVYYKGFGNLFNAIGGGLSNMGGALSRGAGAVSRGATSLFRGGQQASPNVAPSGVNAFSNISGAKGGYSAQPFAQAGGPPSPATFLAPRGSPMGGKPLFTPPPSSMSKPSNVGNLMNKFFPQGASFPSMNFNFSSGGGGGGGNFSSPPQSPKIPPMENLGGSTASGGSNPLQGFLGEGTNMKQVGAGAALSAFGQVASPKVSMPNLAELPNVQRLSSMQFRNMQELDPALKDAINRDFDMVDARERDRLIATYKSLRPGADIETDSSFKRDMMELQDAQGKRRVDQIAKYRFEYLTKQLQMSELELRQMQELANLDIATIMMQLGVDAQAAQDFKQTFSNLGGALMQKGLGINQAPQEEPANAS